MTAPKIGTLLSDVQSEPVAWLWNARIPLGKLTVLDGDPGLGKSTLTLDIAARVSAGTPMPGEADAADPAGVVLLTAEDDLADTVRPRLEAAGADVTRVMALDRITDKDGFIRSPSLPADVYHLRAAIEQMRARLVVIDPLMAFLGADVDAHKDAAVRRALHEVADVAESTGAAVVVIRHLNKSSAGNPLYRGGGSIGIVGAARSGLVVARDPESPGGRVLAITKANLSAQAASIAFHLEETDGASRVVWDGASAHGAAELLADHEADRSAIDEAKAFLRDELAKGPVRSAEVLSLAKREGISDATLRRARNALGIKPGKDGMRGGWYWSMPPAALSQVPEAIPLAVPAHGDDDVIDVID